MPCQWASAPFFEVLERTTLRVNGPAENAMPGLGAGVSEVSVDPRQNRWCEGVCASAQAAKTGKVKGRCVIAETILTPGSPSRSRLSARC